MVSNLVGVQATASLIGRVQHSQGAALCSLRLPETNARCVSLPNRHSLKRSLVIVAAEGATEAEVAPKLAKGAIVRVDKEKYLNSIEFKAVDHPPYFTGLDYIYDARGEILDIREFDEGKEFALVTWAGIPTAPAWLPVGMLIKAPKLEYQRK